MTDSTGEASIGAIAFDCDDPPSLIEFHTSLFGAEAGTCERRPAVKVQGIWLSAHRVAECRRPGWPEDATAKHVHLT